MNIQIICVGKLKEKFFVDASAEYVKRLSKFAKVSIIEIPDEKIPDKLSERSAEKIKDAEGTDILAKINGSSYVFALCIEGSRMSSEDFSHKLSDIMMTNSSISFIIGGSIGLSDKVKSRADCRISFSEMTFPHMLMRIILLEQIYRGFKIMNNENYHK
ncbi:MAG: 23S rRNA (pseudouridine(1915)-N(3))-methyltransferase RlmH [Oscillospiraceae bacterium]|nr:23S rRNA (pseudouridine(1915)-N(3))-methyltransferase RlmH [Oscillospiraceae bacterium]